MSTIKLFKKTAFCASLFLGQASTLLGLVIALGWLFGFVLIVPQTMHHTLADASRWLPIGPPLLGLGLGMAGYLFARGSDEPITGFSLAGMVLNGLALTLTVVLLVWSWCG